MASGVGMCSATLLVLVALTLQGCDFPEVKPSVHIRIAQGCTERVAALTEEDPSEAGMLEGPFTACDDMDQERLQALGVTDCQATNKAIKEDSLSLECNMMTFMDSDLLKYCVVDTDTTDPEQCHEALQAAVDTWTPMEILAQDHGSPGGWESAVALAEACRGAVAEMFTDDVKEEVDSFCETELDEAWKAAMEDLSAEDCARVGNDGTEMKAMCACLAHTCGLGDPTSVTREDIDSAVADFAAEAKKYESLWDFTNSWIAEAEKMGMQGHSTARRVLRLFSTVKDKKSGAMPRPSGQHAPLLLSVACAAFSLLAVAAVIGRLASLRRTSASEGAEPMVVEDEDEEEPAAWNQQTAMAKGPLMTRLAAFS